MEVRNINVEFFNTSSFVSAIRMELAKRIYAAATLLQTTLKDKLSTAYPPASVIGEYPHARTYDGRNSVAVYPSDLATIARNLRTFVGYRQLNDKGKNMNYMAILEESKGRLGLYYCYQQVKPAMASILGGRSYLSSNWEGTGLSPKDAGRFSIG